MSRLNGFSRAGLTAVCLIVIGATGGVALARTVSRPAGSGTPTVVVDYYHNGKFLGTNVSDLDGFDLGWTRTHCAGKWLAKPVVVLLESKGMINSAPIPAPCSFRTAPGAQSGAVHDDLWGTADTLLWLTTGSTWGIGWSVLKNGHGPPISSAKLGSDTTGIHVYLYGGNVFTRESWVDSKGNIVRESPQAKIPTGANQAFVHIQSSTG